MSEERGGSRRLVWLIAVAVLGVGTWYAGTHHIVGTREGLKVYPKVEFTFSETYVDMKSLSFLGLRNYPRTAAAMAQAGDLRLLPGGETLEAVAQLGENVMEAVNRFDSEGEIRSGLIDVANEAANAGAAAAARMNELDETYDISGKASEAAATAADVTARSLSQLGRLLDRR